VFKQRYWLLKSLKALILDQGGASSSCLIANWRSTSSVIVTMVNKLTPCVAIERTCSERWLVRLDRTAPWSCALDRQSRWILHRTLGLLVPASPWTGTDARSATDRPAITSVSAMKGKFYLVLSIHHFAQSNIKTKRKSNTVFMKCVQG